MIVTNKGGTMKYWSKGKPFLPVAKHRSDKGGTTKFWFQGQPSVGIFALQPGRFFTLFF